jgi:hypothetical protein
MAIDWSAIYAQYRGKWVALKDDECTVVASGKTAREALESARAEGYGDPILARMPDELVSYVGFGLG